jgi:hypothetical protein
MHPQSQTHISGALPFIRKLSKQDAALLRRHTVCTEPGCDNRFNLTVVRRNRKPTVVCAFHAEIAPPAKPSRRKRLTRATATEPAPAPPAKPPAPQLELLTGNFVSRGYRQSTTP